MQHKHPQSSYAEKIIEQIDDLDNELNAVELIPLLEGVRTNIPSKDLEEINICLQDINNVYKKFTRSTSEEIIACYRNCQSALKIDSNDPLEQAREIIIKLKTINPHFARLLKIKSILPAKLKQTAVDAFPNDIKAQMQYQSELSFVHFNAAQLAIFSDVIAALKTFIEKKSSKIKHSDINAKIKELEKIQQDIIESMKNRLEKEKPAKKVYLSQLESIMDIQSATDALEENKLDHTYDQKIPRLPFSETEDNYLCIPDYFLNYIYSSRHKENKEWVKNWAGKNNYSLPKIENISLLSPVKDYFFEGANRCSDLINNALDYLRVNYVKPTVDFLENSIDSMRGNFVAVEINHLINRIEQNETFQEIQENLNNKSNLLIQQCTIISNYFSHLMNSPNTNTCFPESYTTQKSTYDHAYQQFQDKIVQLKSLENDWVNLTSDISWDELQGKLNQLSAEMDELKKNFDDTENALRQLNENWVNIHGNNDDVKSSSVTNINALSTDNYLITAQFAQTAFNDVQAQNDFIEKVTVKYYDGGAIIDTCKVVYQEILSEMIAEKANEFFSNDLDNNIKNDFILLASTMNQKIFETNEIPKPINDFFSNIQQEVILKKLNEVSVQIHNYAIFFKYNDNEANAIKEDFRLTRPDNLFSPKDISFTEIIAELKLNFILKKEADTLKYFLQKAINDEEKINSIVDNFQLNASANIKKLSNWMQEDSQWLNQIKDAKNFEIDRFMLINLLDKELKRIKAGQKKCFYSLFMNTAKTQEKISALQNAKNKITANTYDELKSYVKSLAQTKSLIQKRGRFSCGKSTLQSSLEEFIAVTYPHKK